VENVEIITHAEIFVKSKAYQCEYEDIATTFVIFMNRDDIRANPLLSADGGEYPRFLLPTALSIFEYPAIQEYQYYATVLPYLLNSIPMPSFPLYLDKGTIQAALMSDLQYDFSINK
jgi:hypothetical protein